MTLYCPTGLEAFAIVLATGSARTTALVSPYLKSDASYSISNMGFASPYALVSFFAHTLSGAFSITKFCVFVTVSKLSPEIVNIAV